MSHRRLIIFTRYPVPGLTKTRLIPVLGEQGAADLQRAMTEHTAEMMRPLLEERVNIEVRYEGGDQTLLRRWLGEGLSYRPQGEGDLGVRMEGAFRDSVDSGAERIVIIGTDCPDLTPDQVREAFNLLESNPVVLGPAADGGYYLVGIAAGALGKLHGVVFQGIEWGTADVYSNTVNALAEAGIGMGLLDERADVDEQEDLVHWERVLRTQDSGRRAGEEKTLFGTKTKTKTFIPSTASISVIIPTLNEEQAIGRALERLKGSGAEIIVADGGSQDGTEDACRQAGVTFLSSYTGRAAQLNAGAAAALGQILLFLHADTRLPERFEELVRRAVKEGAVAGAFAFGSDLSGASMRLISLAANLRARFLGIVFGDQGIFARADMFREVGGFRDLPVMEDMELVRELKRQGRFVILRQKAISSARRWRSRGVWRTTLANQTVMWLYLLGVEPGRLMKWYRRKLRI